MFVGARVPAESARRRRSQEANDTLEVDREQDRTGSV